MMKDHRNLHTPHDTYGPVDVVKTLDDGNSWTEWKVKSRS